jgi:hypothetical protein
LRGHALRHAPALLVFLALGFALLTSLAPGVHAQEGATPEGGGGESWDREDPACVNAQPRSAQEAEELSERCMKTPEEQEADARDREEAEEASGDDESGQNGVSEGYQRNAGPGDTTSPTDEQAESADEIYDENQDATTEPGGFTGMAVGAFQAILEWLYGVTVEAPSKELSRVITEEAFQSPDLEANGIGGFYERFSDAVKPGAVLVMLYVGYLMMYQGASYNANVTVQNVLPKIFVFFAMIGFLPELVGMLNDLTQALSQSFVSQGTVETFLTGEGSAAHSGPEQGFLAVIANAAAFVMMLLVVFVCGIKNILQTQLYVLSPLAMLLWAAPGLSDLAGAWARAMIACLTLPLVFAVEFAIGAVMINNPGSVFGEGLGNDSVVGSVIVTIVVLYVVWRTPKHMLAWSLTGYSASPGIVAQTTRTLVTKAIPVPKPA